LFQVLTFSETVKGYHYFCASIFYLDYYLLQMDSATCSQLKLNNEMGGKSGKYVGRGEVLRGFW
jgi:hypothetical protein